MAANFLIAMPGGSEWILIVIAVLILFGGRKIPQFMKGLGQGVREFNDAKSQNAKPGSDDSLKAADKPVK